MTTRWMLVWMLVIGGVCSTSAVTSDEPRKYTCVYHFYGEKYGTSALIGEVSANDLAGRDCLLVFRDLPAGKLLLKFLPRTEANDRKHKKDINVEQHKSCSTSFVKIYSVDTTSESLGMGPLSEEDEERRRKKIGHYCHSMLSNKEVKIDFDRRIEIILVQCNFNVFYDYNSTESSGFKMSSYIPPRWIEDSNDTDSSQEKTTLWHPLFLEKEECEKRMKFPCKDSVVCGVANSKFLCNRTKHLCINKDSVCNGINDCLDEDHSDEFRCYFPMIKNSLFALMTVGLCAASTLCCLNHKASLRKNNVVRFQGDVIKRKDIIKAKKQGGFSTAAVANDRKSSLMANNRSVSMASEQSKPRLSFKEPQVRGIKADPESRPKSLDEHDDAIICSTVAAVSEEKLIATEPTSPSASPPPPQSSTTQLHLQEDPAQQPKILYHESLALPDNMSFDHEEAPYSAGGYGYRFEYHNSR